MDGWTEAPSYITRWAKARKGAGSAAFPCLPGCPASFLCLEALLTQNAPRRPVSRLGPGWKTTIQLEEGVLREREGAGGIKGPLCSWSYQLVTGWICTLPPQLDCSDRVCCVPLPGLVFTVSPSSDLPQMLTQCHVSDCSLSCAA